MLGNRLKRLRKENHVTQIQLAERLHVSKATVAMWEVDKRTPSIEMCNSIAKLFGISVGELVSEDEEILQNSSEILFVTHFATLLKNKEIRESLKTFISKIEMEEEENGNKIQFGRVS